MATIIFLLCFSCFAFAQVTPDHLKDSSFVGIYYQGLPIRLHSEKNFEVPTLDDTTKWMAFTSDSPKLKIHLYSIFIDGDTVKEIKSLLNKKFVFRKMKKYHRLINKILSTYENAGYPFIFIKVTVDSFRRNHAFVRFYVSPGNQLSIDSIVQKPLPILSRSFLQTWLQIKPGDLYQEKKIRKLNQKLNNNPWIQATSPPELKFKSETVSLHLSLRRKKSNTFQGLIGFGRTAQHKLQFTGQGNLYVCNLFNLGEELSLQWTGYSQSQLFNLKAKIPYLAGTNLGGSFTFDLHKVDTFFLQAHQTYGLMYSFFPHQISAYYQFRQNVPLIDNEVSQGGNFLHTRHHLGGIKVELKNTDDWILPRRGWEFVLDLAHGTRLTIPAANDSTTLPTQNYLFDVKSIFKTYVPLTSFLGVHFSSHYANIFYPELTPNEAMFLGGFSTLRGFDENSITMKEYILLTIEMRLFFEKYAYVVLFSDYCNGQQWHQKTWYEKNYVSVGGGLTFSVRGGIFRIYYALGKTNPGSFILSSGKIHTGVSLMF
ncbi:MAG: BamA/TamA family outer membrane protein [Bacteroidales bacterium]|nr:BamA/TamA family outer membrane protein [Bacteroidales bacterium]